MTIPLFPVSAGVYTEPLSDLMEMRGVRADHREDDCFCDESQELWSNYKTIRYIYSGWNIIAELDDSLNLEKTYLWGLDEGEKNDYRATSGWSSIGRAAGGVGGLLLGRPKDVRS